MKIRQVLRIKNEAIPEGYHSRYVIILSNCHHVLYDENNGLVWNCVPDDLELGIELFNSQISQTNQSSFSETNKSVSEKVFSLSDLIGQRAKRVEIDFSE